MIDYEQQVMRLVGRPNYAPTTLKGLARLLEIGPEQYTHFRSVVKALLREGRLEISKSKRLTTPKSAKSEVVGTFRRAAKGHGFVRLKGSAADDAVFIPPHEGRDAASGDEVVIKVVKTARGPGRKSEGRIVQVLRRATAGVFVGVYFERGDAGWVRVDGTGFAEPVAVGDPGAKGAKPDDKVAIEMVRYPSPGVVGEAVITEVLGPRGEPGIDTLSVIRAFNLPEEFEEDALAEARELAATFREDETEGREDLRGLFTITIDPVDARDFDDAISLERDERGFWSLSVHIADVARFVTPGSALDREARKRATSVYLPDRVLPMLPEILSNGLASLQAGRPRVAVTVQMEFSPDGIRTATKFLRSLIKVDRRFTYEEALAVLRGDDEAVARLGPDLTARLNAMRTLANLLRERRRARGAIELNMPEVKVILGDAGEVAAARLVAGDESHELIEDFMLAANEAVAAHLREHNVGFLRRAHPDPDPAKLYEFADFARGLGLKVESPQSRFELRRLLAESKGRPEAEALHYAFLRSLKQALYTPEDEGHYALASDDYCHFTSPIRRYPDLQVHRQVIALLEDRKPRSDYEELTALGEHCTKNERRAEAAERELTRIKLLTHLAGQVGEVFTAVIVGVEDYGLFCRLIAWPVEGLLRVDALEDDYYYLEPETRTLIGRRAGRRYRLGDRLDVRVARVDIDRRTLDLVPSSTELDRSATDGSDSARTSPARARAHGSRPGGTRPASGPHSKAKKQRATKHPGSKRKPKRGRRK